MRVCGVVCEYNPFHRGHALHLRLARARAGADYVVCVMSGALTQRGHFARHDKWTRARMALESGADLVLELPVRFACASAPDFARGGVGLLCALGVVTHLSFGCEAEALPHLSAAAQLLGEETPALRGALREGMARGLSYPQAMGETLRLCLPPEGAQACALPNAALALEYLRALPGSITPVPVAREGAGYHDEALAPLASATAVRAALERGDLTDALSAVPCPDLLRSAEERGAIHAPEALTQALLCRLRTTDAAALSDVPGMDEGLEHRFLAAARTCPTRDALILAVKSRRYTYARLSRLCALILLGATRAQWQAQSAPAWARILGFRRSAAPLLREIKRRAAVPLFTRAAELSRSDARFALDVRAQDLWALGCASPAQRDAGRDFTTSPIIIP